MSRDFAKKKPKKKKPSVSRSVTTQSTIPGWIWFICGIVVTIFCQFLFHLAKQPPQDEVKQKPAIHWPQEKKEPAKKPQLNFYDALKKQDIKVSDEVVDNREDGTYAFSLQVGSFRNLADAETLRAELILKGYDTSIQKTLNQQNTTWYRVIVGPFNSRSLYAKARARLLDQGIRPIKTKNKI